MGLDTVEFVMFAEKEFGIEIPDARATEIRTMAEFVACIAQLRTEQGVCQFLPKMRYFDCSRITL
jgi:hypothetical protein